VSTLQLVRDNVCLVKRVFPMVAPILSPVASIFQKGRDTSRLVREISSVVQSISQIEDRRWRQGEFADGE